MLKFLGQHRDSWVKPGGTGECVRSRESGVSPAPGWMSGAAVRGMGEFAALSADLGETCSSHMSCLTTLHD